MRSRTSRRGRLIGLILWLSLPAGSGAAEVTAAVAANFAAAAKQLAIAFERETGHRAVLSFGSTGKLYAQILHGAPYEVFLAADQQRPALLERAGAASQRFTYAVGRLVLWSPDPALVDPQAGVLHRGRFRRLAIANPKTAPYGAAALEVLANLGLSEALAPKLVRGESIAQAYQFVATGNAELGLVALAQVARDPSGSRWLVPPSLHAPLRQDAVLLARGTGNPAAQALLAFLQGATGRAIIGEFGYVTD